MRVVQNFYTKSINIVVIDTIVILYLFQFNLILWFSSDFYILKSPSSLVTVLHTSGYTM